MLAGLLLANPSLKLDGGSQRVIRRASAAKSGKVVIASGGAIGHLAPESGARVMLEHFKPLRCKIGLARVFPEKNTGAHDPGQLLERDEASANVP
jgi:hypothetical protein